MGITMNSKNEDIISSNGMEDIDNVNKYSNNCRIPVLFDRKKWDFKQLYHINIQHAIDPSKFWITNCYPELKTLYSFIQDIYTNSRWKYRIPVSKIKNGMYCIVYNRGYYYRAALIEVPLTINCECIASVRLIDYGCVEKIPIQDIYYMTNKLYTVPELAIRATLSALAPLNSNIWSFDASQNFLNKSGCKKFLCQVTNADYKNKILYVRLWALPLDPIRNITINQILIDEKIARRLTVADMERMNILQDKLNGKNKQTKSQFQFLFPTFHDVENCFAATFDIAEYLYYLTL